MKWESLINSFTLYNSSIEHNINLMVILFSTHSPVPFLCATADKMPAKNEKAKVLHYREAQTKYLCVLIHIGIKGEVGAV